MNKTVSFQVYGQSEKGSVAVKWSGDGIEEPNYLTNDIMPGMVVCEDLFRRNSSDTLYQWTANGPVVV